MKLSSTDKGALVAIANLVTIAVCCAIMFGTGTTQLEWKLVESFPQDALPLGLLVLNMALFPALIVGVGLGKLGQRLAGSPRQRYTWLALAALGSVCCFGALVGWVQLIPFATIPTLVWTWHLERWTRDAGTLPAARTTA